MGLFGKLGLIVSITLANSFAYAQLITEILVNPNGGDSNCEFVEIFNGNSAPVDGLFFAVIEGDSTSTVGAFDRVVDLSAQEFGTNGMLVITNDAAGDCSRTYNSPPTARILVPNFSMENGTTSFALIFSPSVDLVEGTDYDSNNDGTLDALPGNATILDSFGFRDTGAADISYGPQLVAPSVGGASDMASRFPNNFDANTETAWFHGDMDGISTSLAYDLTQVSSNFPAGGMLTPGDNFAEIPVNHDMANAILIEELPYMHKNVLPKLGTEEQGQAGCNVNIPSVNYKFRVIESGTITISLSNVVPLSEPLLFRATSLDETNPSELVVYDNQGADGGNCFGSDGGLDGMRTATVNAGDIFYVFVINDDITDITFTGDAILSPIDLCIPIKTSNGAIAVVCL